MTERPSPERLEQIREYHQAGGLSGSGIVTDLLAEIDALRAEAAAAHVAGFRRGCAYSRAECESVNVDSKRSAYETVTECAERISALFRDAERHGKL